MLWYFLFFFISGFCSVLYELVWLRLTMAQFGVTTAMVSIVLSVFMAGLGLGSWASGKWFGKTGSSGTFPALRLYGLIELLIGASGLVVPPLLIAGHRLLENYGPSGSFSFYVAAGLWVAITLIPWCALMGATVPVGMRAIGETLSEESSRSFSYLYMANVAGAVAGNSHPTFPGGTTRFSRHAESRSRGQLFDCRFGARPFAQVSSWCNQRTFRTRALSSPSGGKNSLTLLFLTGLTAMAMEVVWVRRYTLYLGTLVYAFASILAVLSVSDCARSRSLSALEFAAKGVQSRNLERTGGGRSASARRRQPGF